ncbi:hypothetical protein SAMN05421678_10171 [Actinopolymorpha cephalotaxi]|uniref:Major Facilitator Superfamily protein n=1 Tax=Actinopolymorpha cephalotaxi TaxID=504797 RepID=A0A1I2K849_9ACTN|nr:MFS transporter [Actinopolymorpha cephalotaxi]NYH85917.1 hypothetical protein [Actinopolymorpha cephalotaxi]SFF62498.1 hypothetical protein SAMN05421678_10171 [Actinopolymorpha cephalotaxi]
MTVQDTGSRARAGWVTRVRRFGLPRYLLAATLARTADAGAAVGLLLLAADRHDGATALTGGLLAAALTAPHLLGPLLARRLDSLADGRRMLATASCAYGVFLAAGALLTGRAPLPVAVVAVALAGSCGPLLTSGLSSQLAGVLRNGGEAERSTRRAEGWDALTYGLAGTAGPAAVAVLAAATTPLVAVLTLAAAADLGGLLTLSLPRRQPQGHDAEKAMPTRQVLGLLARFGPLRRVTYATMLTALVLGGIPVLAVTTGARLGSGAAAGAALVTAFGVGNLGGSLLVTAFPLGGEPERLTTRYVWVLAGVLALTAAAPTYWLALAGFALVGAANAPFFAATLAARSAYSPASARAQVFAAVAGFKIAAASAGTALAGLLSGHDPRWILLGSAALVGAGAAATVAERRRLT